MYKWVLATCCPCRREPCDRLAPYPGGSNNTWAPCCYINLVNLQYRRASLPSTRLMTAWYSWLTVINFLAGFPSQKGRHRLRHNPVWAEAVCEQVPLAPYVFYPDKPVHIQVSVNHVNFSDPEYVHEAVVAWVEEILEKNFTVCVTQAGRNEKRNGETFATVDWLAYQGAPDGGLSGKIDMPTWLTGTSCRTVSLPSVRDKFVLVYFWNWVFNFDLFCCSDTNPCTSLVSVLQVN